MPNDGRDTSLGGARKDFPTTLWTQFLVHGSSMDHLARTYWKPIYCYIRVKWAKTNEEAKDMTQEFFVWVMDTEFLSKMDRDRGRFRAFLRTSLDHYLVSRDRKQQAIKRGGGRLVLDLDNDRDGLPAIQVPDPLGRTPDQILDESWKQEILQAGMARLETVLTEEGKPTHFALFLAYCQPGTEKPGMKDLAAAYGMELEEVANCIRTIRQRCRNILSDIVAETVRSREDQETEMNWFFGQDGP